MRMQARAAEVVRRADRESVGIEVVVAEQLAPKLIFIVAANPHLSEDGKLNASTHRIDLEGTVRSAIRLVVIDAADAGQEFRVGADLMEALEVIDHTTQSRVETLIG